MAVESADDRAIFVGVDDFGVAATFNAATVNGIFDNEFVEVDAGGGVGFALQQPRLFAAPQTFQPPLKAIQSRSMQLVTRSASYKMTGLV